MNPLDAALDYAAKGWRVTRDAIRELRNGSGDKPACRDADADLSSWREVAL